MLKAKYTAALPDSSCRIFYTEWASDEVVIEFIDRMHARECDFAERHGFTLIEANQMNLESFAGPSGSASQEPLA